MTTMPSQDQHPSRDATIVVGQNPRLRQPADPTSTTSGRRAMWSALIALAIVVVMFGVFYDISAQRDQTASGPAITAPQTTGQGGAPRQDAR
jgi:hypothetical protein